MYNPKEYKNIRMTKIDACWGGHSFGDDVVLEIHQVKEPQTTGTTLANGQYGTIGIGEKASLMVLIGTPTEVYENQKLEALEKNLAEQKKQNADLQSQLKISVEENAQATLRLNEEVMRRQRFEAKLAKYDDMTVAIKKYENDIIKMTKHFGTAAINEALKD